jgi:hypothetical protein
MWTLLLHALNEAQTIRSERTWTISEAALN